jgi:hypothetical protein
LEHCPACGSSELEAVVDRSDGEVNFHCRACDRFWHVELGFVHRVVPR